MANEPAAGSNGDKLHYVLRLYITGLTPRSMRAIENMRRICSEHLAGRYELDVIDIYQNPEASREQQIIAAPTLVKLLPLPLRRIIGDLSNEGAVLASLDLQPKRGNGDQASKRDREIRPNSEGRS